MSLVKSEAKHYILWLLYNKELQMVNSNSMYLFIWYPVNWSNLCAQRDKDVTGNSNFYRDRCIYASADQLMRYISASMDNILTCDKDHKAKNIS